MLDTGIYQNNGHGKGDTFIMYVTTTTHLVFDSLTWKGRNINNDELLYK